MRIAILLCCLFPPIVFAQQSESDSREDNTRMRQRLERYKEDASSYEFFRSGKPKSPDNKLQLVEKPLISYFNSSTANPGDTHQGAYFIWTYRGRPEIISAIWSMGPEVGTHGVRHEFHTLSLEPLAPMSVGNTRARWAPSDGIELSPIPNASNPSQSNKLRLTQMRSLSRGFIGYTHQPRTNGKPWKMRTATQPIYRYESNELGVLDGALFPIFADWDPEIVLVIEARKKSSGEDYEWLYSAIRYNTCPLRLEYKGKEVWRAEQCGFSEPSNTYFLTGGGRIALK